MSKGTAKSENSGVLPQVVPQPASSEQDLSVPCLLVPGLTSESLWGERSRLVA
jgi:hypothetical protein